MVGCSAINCSNKTGDPNISFHRLPNKTEKLNLRKKWLQKMRREDISTGQNVVLCSAHFFPEDFQRDLKVRN